MASAAPSSWVTMPLPGRGKNARRISVTWSSHSPVTFAGRYVASTCPVATSITPDCRAAYSSARAPACAEVSCTAPVTSPAMERTPRVTLRHTVVTGSAPVKVCRRVRRERKSIMPMARTGTVPEAGPGESGHRNETETGRPAA